MRPTILGLALSLAAFSTSAGAEDSWSGIRHQLFGDRPILPGTTVIALDAPYRTDNDARTVIGADLAAPAGQLLRQVTVVLDENPMPVSAVFKLSEPAPRFGFETTLRINGPTPLHVVAETENGQLFVAEGFVKTSGQGACAAPPGTDPEQALASLGDMSIEIGDVEAGNGGRLLDALARLKDQQMQMRLNISHPSHSGMQMDQITLLFIPMRYVEDVAINLDGKPFVDLTGSISLSENPEVTLSIPAQTHSVDVTMTDTDGTVSHASRSLTNY